MENVCSLLCDGSTHSRRRISSMVKLGRHTIRQGEGGEQGDALMPLLFSLGQQRALRAIAGQLKDGERLFAFLVDLYVSCQPARVAEIHRVMRVELRTHWTMGRPSCGTKQASSQAEWKSFNNWPPLWMRTRLCGGRDPLLQTSAQGVKNLGTPIGHEAFVKAQLVARRADHDVLLERIPAVPDLQAAWVIVILRVCSGQFRIAHSAT